MATVKVIEVIRRVEDIVQDTGIRWPRAELQSWLNEAYLAVISLRPDANSQTGTFTCVGGTRQVVTATFANAMRLLDIIRNLTVSSNLRAIRPIDRRMLDDQRPAWHSEDKTVNLQHFMFDPRLPKEFLVYPPALAGTQIEIAYSITVVAHAMTEAQLDPQESNTTVIQIDDVYAPALVDYILSRAYSKDTDYGSNEQRASTFMDSFIGRLSNKSQTDSAVDPKATSTVT